MKVYVVVGFTHPEKIVELTVVRKYNHKYKTAEGRIITRTPFFSYEDAVAFLKYGVPIMKTKTLGWVSDSMKAYFSYFDEHGKFSKKTNFYTREMIKGNIKKNTDIYNQYHKALKEIDEGSILVDSSYISTDLMNNNMFVGHDVHQPIRYCFQALEPGKILKHGR